MCMPERTVYAGGSLYSFGPLPLLVTAPASHRARCPGPSSSLWDRDRMTPWAKPPRAAPRTANVRRHTFNVRPASRSDTVPTPLPSSWWSPRPWPCRRPAARTSLSCLVLNEEVPNERSHPTSEEALGGGRPLARRCTNYVDTGSVPRVASPDISRRSGGKAPWAIRSSISSDGSLRTNALDSPVSSRMSAPLRRRRSTSLSGRSPPFISRASW
jgi:hypothetical protein